MSSGKPNNQAALSKADYLKKYLSEGTSSDAKSKKKKPKKAAASSTQSRVRVFDDDADDMTVEQPAKGVSTNAFLDHDDASDPDEVNFRPTIADVIDERPEEVQILEKFSSTGKWKGVGDGQDKSAVMMMMTSEMVKRKQISSSIKIESQPVDSVKQEELQAGVIILPDVRKSTALRKAEEAAALSKSKEDERQEKYLKWSKGLAQIAQQRERAEDAIKEMAKPLARYVDDEDLERELKSKDRIGDPMLAFMKDKKQGITVAEDDFSGSSSSAVKRPTRGPPNRFNIPPGLRWDGVDRSNGFERDLFLKIADRKTVREEEYIWSVEDW